MTTLQEAARKALACLELYDHEDLASCEARHELRTALAQQVEQQPVAWYEYNQDLDAWFLAYHNPKAKTRPLVFGDTATPAPLAQQELPQKERTDFMAGYDAGMADAKRMAQQGEQAKPVAYITQTEQGPMVWTPEMYDEACTYCDDGEFPVPLYTVAPAPQAQPMTNPCKTCSHFQEGKLPGVRIHDETCYECRSYWGNKWEAA